jgi:peptidoglycan/LPS O-acetylase OafA/YrhL
VERFAPIEGLRAWLAWAVFLGHIVLFAGLSRSGFPERLGDIASVSVDVFIIVSGFVITHLLLTRQEPYLPYIAKRFFRLFPTFVVCAVAGAVAIAVSRTPWPGDPTYQYGQQLVALQDAQARHFTTHVLLHLTMLHGMVPNNVLNVSQWALLPTAWSASLEWQFYLVAPAVLLLFRRKGGALVVALLTVAGLWSYGHGYLGTFESPSILPGAAEFFLLGIASRFCWGEIKLPSPAVVAPAILAIGYLTEQMAIGLWLAFLTYMVRVSTETKASETSGADRWFVSAGDALFASRFAEWAGKRTYCVYLVHYPIFQLLLTAIAFAGVTAPDRVAGLLLLLGFPATALAAEVAHRYVELPGMALGKELARRLSYKAQSAVEAAA